MRSLAWVILALTEEFPVKTTLAAKFAVASMLGALALSACSSDSGSGDNAGSTSGGSIACESGTIKGSGSSAQANAMTEWIKAYQTACPDATIDYQGTGSSAGITDFINKQVQFAGSDSALKDADVEKANARCAAGPALNIPMVGGAIALAYNIEGAEKLTLNADTIAGIYASKITKWNDPAIVALNSGVTLPDAAIQAFHRSDGSGTTDNFTKYLKAAAPSVWTFDSGKEWKAPGGQGANKSDGMASAVKSTKNAIAYVELSFVKSQSLTAASVDSGSGAIEATSDNAAKFISSAKVKGTGNDLSLSIDYAAKVDGAYPIVLVTYEITCEKGLDATKDLPLTKSFLTYTASDDAQAMLTAEGYVPITGDLLTKVRASIAAIS